MRDAAGDRRETNPPRKDRAILVDTLSRRLALVFALLLLPPTVLSLYLAVNSFIAQKERAQLQVRQFAALTATYESKFFDNVRQALKRIGERPELTQGVTACSAVLDAALADTREFDTLGYFDTEGRQICATDGAPDDVSSRDWMHDVLRFRGFGISDYTVTPGSPYPVIVAAQAINDIATGFQGVVAASIRLYWLSAFARELSLPVDSVIFLVDANGNVLADRAAVFGEATPDAAGGAAGTDRRDALIALVGAERISALSSRGLDDFEAVGRDGIRRVFSSVALPHGDVTVLFGMPARTARGWLERELFTRVMGLAAIWLAGIGAAVLGTRYLVTRWTTALRRTANAYAHGDYGSDGNFTDAPRELRDLGDTLNLMARRIADREAALRASLSQKEFLLKEVHHRVKNNLQIVSSLLNIRAGSLSGQYERETLAEVKANVRALALVHRHLYESDDLERVDMRSFLSELCRSALAGLVSASDAISLDLDVQSFLIETDRAIPIALLVTEAMTNSVKHAFPGGRPGLIRVALRSDGPESGVLTISDDGVGLPPGADLGDGLGLDLIRALARQVGGEVAIRDRGGVVVELRFTADGR